MKTSIKGCEYVAAIFFAMLTVFFGQNLAYGIDVADRTPQVRNAIVVAAGVETPEEVTEAHLSTITSLSLGLSNITSLNAGDFEGLTSLRVLLLNNNQLEALPETVFRGLTSLQVLLLNNNQLTVLPETIFNSLTSLEVLLLNNNQLSTLPVGVFSGLTSLQSLYLDSNRLTVLPDSVFSGLTSLQYLYLSKNAVAPVGLTVSLERVADGQFKAVVPTGAPFDIPLPIDMTNGSMSSGETSLTIPQGRVESEIFSVTRTPGTLAAVTVEIGALPGLPEEHSGYALVQSGDLPIVLIGSEGIHPLSDRTQQVRDAIVVAAGVETPAEVTEDHLSAITSLSLSFNEITSLTVTDFDGLISLRELHLNNNQLSTLPETVFRGLTSLQVLLLNNNQLTVLPETIFNSLTSLEVLLLNNNQLSTLPVGVFSGLTSLQSLYLDSNRLTVLPDSVFSGLTSLQYLYLSENAVTPVGLPVSLERVANGQFKAVAPTGAPFDILLPIHITDGSLSGSATTLTIRQGHVESETFSVARTPGILTAITAEISALPGLPEEHSGYTLVASGDLSIVVFRADGINPLSHRTQQVRDAIVVAAGVTSAEEVTAADLSDITSLDLSGSNITSLSAGDFDDLTALKSLLLNNNHLTTLPETVFSGLTALQSLYLNNNYLIDLPVGVFNGLASLRQLHLNRNALTFLPSAVFSGLTSLQSLDLSENAMDPVELTVSLERVADGQFKAVAPTGAPFDMVLPFRITNGRISSGETALTIPQGHVESEILTVDHTFETLMLVTAALETLPSLPAGHNGYALIQPSDLPLVLFRSDGIHPISDRTPEVRDAIVVAAGVNSPDEVTEDHLSAITSLNLGLSNITSVNAVDFEGLTALQVLLLNNNHLTDLPETVFSTLPSLQHLDLSTNQLTDLPAAVFSELTALQSLNLSNNAVAPVGLPVSLERVSEGQFKAVVPTGAPFDILLPINITNGSMSSGETTLTIPQGHVESDVFSVIRTPGTIGPITAALETLPGLPVAHSGYALVKSSDFSVVLIGSGGIHPLSERTPEVSDAIVATVGVHAPAAVSAAHLSAITSLNLGFREITSLNARDFDGLTSLQVLLLNNNQLTDLPETVFNGLTSLQYLYVDNNALTALPEAVFSGLTALQVLLLNNNALTDLPETVFNGLTSLQQLDLDNNALSDLPETVFNGLTALQQLNLNNNAMDPIALTVSLERVAEGQQFKAVVPTGSPFDILLPINITNGSLLGGVTSLTIPQGHIESDIFTVHPTPGTRTPVTADIGTFPRLPIGHSGYTLVKSGDLPLVLTRSDPIHVLSDRTPQVRDAIVAAADVETPDEVTAAHLSAITELDLSDSNIVSLKAGDFEGLTALIGLRLNNNHLTFLPVGIFSGLSSLQRLDLSNNPLIFLPVGIFGGLASLEALLLNNNTLTALPETVFNGVTSLQQINLSTNRLTFLPAGTFNGLTSLQSLDLSENAMDPVELTVSLERVADGQFKAVALTGSPFDIVLPIRITNGRISGGVTTLTIPQGHVESENLAVTQVFETLTTVTADIGALPGLPEEHSGYTLVKSSALPIALFQSDRINPISDRTQQVQDAIVVAAGVGTPEEVTEDHLASITSLSLTNSNITSLKARDFEGLMSLQVLLLNNNPFDDLPDAVFTGLTALQYLDLNSNQLAALPEAVFSRLTSLQHLDLSDNAVDPIELRVSLERVADGQFKAVALTGAPFDIVLSIRMTNGNIIGGATALTIRQGDVESKIFSVIRTPGTVDDVTAEIETLPDLPVGHSGYALVKPSDRPLVLPEVPGSGDPVPPPGNSVPIFTEGSSTSRAVAENTPPNTNIGTPVAATDADGDTRTYRLGGTDSAAFSILSTTGQLETKAALDYETQDTYTVVVSVSDGNGGGDSIAVTINITDVNDAPVFTDGTTATRAVAENTATGQNIGTAVAATDQDRIPDSNNEGEFIAKDTITYTLSGADAASFSIDSGTEQLKTSDALDFETDDAYEVTVTATDGGNLTDSITVTISVTNVNEAPTFATATTTRAIAENTDSGQNIGAAITATDPDSGDTLTYSLSGTDAASFDIVSTSGQLQTSAALDYETDDTYEVTVTATDGGNLTDTITVTISVTDVNDAPAFSSGATISNISATKDIAITSVNLPEATDPDASTTLTYTLTPALPTGLTFTASTRLLAGTPTAESDSATYTYTASDSTLSDTLTFTIEVTICTPVNERTPKVRNAIVAAIPGVDSAADVTPAHLSAITTLDLPGVASADDVTRAHLPEIELKDGDFDCLTSLTYLRLSFNSISDISPLQGLTSLTELQLHRNSISDISPLQGLTSLTELRLHRNSISDISVLQHLTSLTKLRLHRNSISDASALEHLTKLTDLQVRENPISDYGPLRRLKTAIEAAGSTIDIDIDLNNNPPVFTEGTSTTRSVPENTARGENIGNPIAATDPDAGSTLTYSLGGTDAASFLIRSNSGQLRTQAPLDYETKKSYTVTVDVIDNRGGMDRTTVTINVTDVAGAAPSVETPPVIPEKTVLLTNYPNPFNPETWIPYQLSEPVEVTLTIYNMRGVVVRELKLGHQPAGFYQSRSRAIHWDGRNMFGEKVATGVYFYTLKAGEFSATRKMLIRK